MGIKQTTAFVDLDAIRENYQYIRRGVAENVSIMAVVKANAYGHGVKQVCAELVECGADWFGVARVSEAVELRRCGITKPILILGYTDPELAKLLYAEQLTQTVFSTDYARRLGDEAKKASVTVNCHIKLDTGMTRLGFRGESGAEIAQSVIEVLNLPGLNYTGIFTHFSSADELTDDCRAFTLRQGELFAESVEELKRQGHGFKYIHACNSAGTLYYPQFHFNMVRPGIALYGYSPLGEPDSALRPAMELKTVVESVKTVSAGAEISYGREYKADSEMQVAALGAGYADGVHRSLSGKGMVWVNGMLAPMVGRICMDQLMADVTGLEISSGDEATIFGGGSPITAESVAALCGTNSYECICAVARRVPRVYIKGGAEV